MKYIASIIIACALAGLGSSCVGPNQERNALGQVQYIQTTVDAALDAWNEYIGAQINVLPNTPEPERAQKIRKLADADRRVQAAVIEYNKAKLSLRTAWKAYKDMTLDTNAPPVSFDNSLITQRAEQVRIAANAITAIVQVWIPEIATIK